MRLTVLFLTLLTITSCGTEEYRLSNSGDSYDSAFIMARSSPQPVEGWTAFALWDSEEIIYVDENQALDNKDIETAVVRQREDYRPSFRERLANRKYEDHGIPLANLDDQPIYQMDIELTPPGAQEFYDLTSSHETQYVAVVIDGEVILHAKVMEPIPGGKVTVTGSYALRMWKEIARAITGNQM